MVDIGTNEYSNSTNSKIDVQFLTNLILKKWPFVQVTQRIV
jgi:hypothetical protein